MKIILKENIENLGSKGDIVNVAAGYGRNYLLPKKLALEVTSSNMKMIEMEQAALKKNLEKARSSYQGAIQKLNEVSLSFERKAGEKDTIFGSVTVTDIKEELDKLGFEIEKKKILLKDPIKRIGNYTVSIKVFLDDVAEIKIQVVPEGAAAESASQKDIVEPASEVLEETPKEKSVTKAPKKETETDKPEEKKEEVIEEEKTEQKSEVETEEVVVEKAIPEEIAKEEEKDESDEKSKTSQ